jgi:DNA-binding response OmpR family regulator
LSSILLLEDDPLLAKSLQKYLMKNDYNVEWVKDGNQAIEATYSKEYSLYLFDINVPLMQGDDLLKSLRDAGDTTPTILISALVDIESITKGFRSGADDYIKKPFSPDELLVRIAAKTNKLKPAIHYKEYELLVESEQIFYKGEEIFLPTIAKHIFIALLKNYPNPVTKEELLLFLEAQNDLALRVNITKLKQKVDATIENVRGVGYKLT